jgi:predicted nuclease of predicted toxin-antitoxin system
MRIVADENIEREFIEALREADFDVIAIIENYIGASDDEILQIAVENQAVILT